MKRRDFAGGLAAWVGGARVAPVAVAGAAGLAVPAVQAQEPRAGADYQVLAQPVAGGADGKIEVVEFFWYGCPHCNRFEPLLDTWVHRQPADVSFRRVPVAFRDDFVAHQRIFYTLESLGQLDAVHRKVFHAIHVERKQLRKTDDIADFAASNGIDRAKFLEVFNSFGVQTKTRQARQIADAYRIDGVPALGVQGRYLTSGAMAGSLERSLVVADHLIAQVRAQK